MRRLNGFLVLVALLLLVGGVSLAQTRNTTNNSFQDDRVDQPIRKAADTEPVDEEEEEEVLPDPPPFFGEDGGVGETYKIVWCLDRSGSMRSHAGAFPGPDGKPTTGSRWERAKAETIVALGQLTSEWEFGIIIYNCSHEKFQEVLVKATPKNVGAARAWIEGKIATGATGTGPAQKAAFLHASGGSVPGSATCWLLTDGMPNCGATGTVAHKNLALKGNRDDHVLNAIGIADYGRFTVFLQELAAATGGTYTHID